MFRVTDFIVQLGYSEVSKHSCLSWSLAVLFFAVIFSNFHV
jgi:hypothetical protein